MKAKFIRLIIVIGGILLLQTSLFGQYKYSFDVKFLKARFTDTTDKKDVLIVFYISANDSLDFPPILHLPPKSNILLKGVEKDIALSPENLAISLDGDKLILTNIVVYDLIKGMVDLNANKNMMILSFRMKDVSTEPFSRMNLTLMLGEKRNPNVEFSKKFEFDVQGL